MTTHVEAVGEVDATYSSCDECAKESGLSILQQFVPGILSAFQEAIIEMKASIHEQATGHHVLVIKQRRPQ
jgi:hypothetical protein